MSMITGLKTRLRLLLTPRDAEARMEEEFRFHVEMETEKRMRAGMSPAAARREALRAFGGLERHRERMRDGRGGRWLADLGLDLRYAGRTLRKSPGFALVAVLTLALGIGANTAIFSVVHAVLFRPLPVENLERISTVSVDMPGLDLMGTQLAPIEVTDMRAREDLFEAAAGVAAMDATMTGEGEPTRVRAARTLGDFFTIFGVQPAAGRLYGPDASAEGAPRIVVVSHGLWQQLGGGDPDFLGRTLQLNDQTFEVVGVAPPGFSYPKDVEVWYPFTLDARWAANRGSLFVTGLIIPRGEPSPQELAARLTALGNGWNEQYAEQERFQKQLHATPFVEHLAGSLKPVMLVLSGAVVLVLLIAVANVANLQLLRATGRGRELAVRASMGATRMRVIRQLTVENVVLAVAGAAAGVWLAVLALSALEAWGPASDLFLTGIPLDATVLALAVGLSLLTAVVFGTVPALRASRVNPQAVLRESSRGTSHGRGRNRLLRTSVVVQVALATMLLVGSGLMVRTLASLLGTDPGLRTEGVTVYGVSAPPGAYTAETRGQLWGALQERVRGLPGVEHAAFMSQVPFKGGLDSSPFDIPGVPAREGEPQRHAEARFVSDGVFRTLGIPLRAGRDFRPGDAGGEAVVIIDETFAEQFFPGENPVGRKVQHYVGESTIIGVAGRVDQDEIGDAPKASAYYSTHQYGWISDGLLVVRSGLSVDQVVPAVRGAVRQVDGAIPVFDVATMDALMRGTLGSRRLALLALGAFAGLALLLTALGVYGVMRYSTQERTHEIGVRMALGAHAQSVVGMVVRQGVTMSVLGALLGVLGALALTRFMRGILFGVSPTDPLTFVGVTLLLLAVTGGAAWLPARRAATVSPIRALKRD